MGRSSFHSHCLRCLPRWVECEWRGKNVAVTSYFCRFQERLLFFPYGSRKVTWESHIEGRSNPTRYKFLSSAEKTKWIQELATRSKANLIRFTSDRLLFFFAQFQNTRCSVKIIEMKWKVLRNICKFHLIKVLVFRTESLLSLLIILVSSLQCIDGFCCSEFKDGENNIKICFVGYKHISEGCSSVNDTIGGFNVQGNVQLNYLPTDVGERFPNVKIFDAGSCSIKAISKANFKKMGNLRTLWLGYNQIEEIHRGTFEDLKSLKSLFLGE